MAAILIVDDDAVIRDVLYELLSEDHVCQTAETAEHALTLLESRHFDLAILDISLPGMSGLDLLGHIRQRWPETLVIIITGIDYHQYVSDLVKMGASDYLVKPFQIHDAEEKVAQAILRQEGWLDAVKESTNRALKQTETPAVEVSAGMIDRRRAARLSIQRPARLIFTSTPAQAGDSLQPTPILIGHTRDISATGLSLVVPGINESDAKFYGVRAPLQITLSLPKAMIAVEVSPVRYQWLGEAGTQKSYLIGAQITSMNQDHTSSFNEYLGEALAPREFPAADKPAE